MRWLCGPVLDMDPFTFAVCKAAGLRKRAEKYRKLKEFPQAPGSLGQIRW